MTTSRCSSINHYQWTTSLWINWYRFLRDQAYLSQVTTVISEKIPPTESLPQVTGQPRDTPKWFSQGHSNRVNLLTLLWKAQDFEWGQFKARRKNQVLAGKWSSMSKNSISQPNAPETCQVTATQTRPTELILGLRIESNSQLAFQNLCN